MYAHKEEDFGGFKKHTFFNAKTGNGFSLVPEIGGTLLELWLDQRQILDGCNSPEELKNNQAYKSSILFPFPNRLRDGKYELNGDHFVFPINEPGNNNTLHGMSRDVPMDVFSKDVGAESASISLSYFYEGEEKGYPFPFLFDLEYRISDSEGFQIKMKFTNEADHSIPVGLGWHPYFKIGGLVDHLSLQIPDSKMIEIDERMIPTGNLLNYDYFKEARPIGKAVLDNTFKLNEVEGRQEVLLSSNDYSLRYWQETGLRKFNYLQIYTPPNRYSVAIEPMTCNIDAFNNGDGLVILKPEESLEVKAGVKFGKGTNQ